MSTDKPKRKRPPGKSKRRKADKIIMDIKELGVNTRNWISYIYIYSLLIEKDVCDCQNGSIHLACVCVCLFVPRSLHSFDKSFLFHFLLVG